MKPAHRPDLLLKDLGGLLLYYPGVSLAEAAPRRLLGPLAALGGDLVRHATQPQAEAEDELRRLRGQAKLGVAGQKLGAQTGAAESGYKYGTVPGQQVAGIGTAIGTPFITAGTDIWSKEKK